MKHKQIAFGVVGLLIGFVLGFFVNKALVEPSAAAPAQASAAASGQLPEGHPPIDALQEIQELEQHAKEHPDHADVKIRLGNSYYNMGRYDVAIGWYESALQLEPNNVDVNNDLATCYFATGDASKAIELLQKSLQLEKDNPVALQNLGWFYFSTNNYPAAIENWEKLIAVHPDFRNIEAVKEQLEKARGHMRGEHS